MADGSLHLTGLLALLLLGAPLPEPVTAVSCSQEQYVDSSGGQAVCCNYCAAGQEISDVCTPSNKASTCRNCKETHYNPKNARDRCPRCTVCNKLEGSIEKEPCTKSSNAVCECPEGSTPKNDRKTACRCDKGKEIINNKCQRCKSGYFSTKENSVCHPWTDCSAMGQSVLEQGSAVEDVKCTKPTPVTAGIPTTSWTPSSSNHRRKVTSLKNFTATTNHVSITTHLPTPSNSVDWGTLSLILIVAILLLSAGVIVTMITQINRKKTNRGFIRGERCKVPVQEESTSSDSSLTKDCPA